MTRPLKKLLENNFGPFKIIAQVGPASFMLRLPEHMKAVHPVFHVSQLELSTPNMILNRIQCPPPPVEVDDDIENEIAEILDSKLDQHRKCKLLYLVRWTGYAGTDQEINWLVATKLTHASKLVADFHSANPSKPCLLNSLSIQVSNILFSYYKIKRK